MPIKYYTYLSNNDHVAIIQSYMYGLSYRISSMIFV